MRIITNLQIEFFVKGKMELDQFLQARYRHPVIDVRSQGEFEQGHIAKAVNLPILNNEEREKVGIDYKQKGSAEAILTGFKLIGPRLESILESTKRVANGDEVLVYCWRGGMRSDYYTRFISMVGVQSQRLNGGYKAYRQHALDFFSKPFPLMVIAGCTGSGKSEILQALGKAGEQIIDLESLANHKGSVFGGLMKSQQPSVEQFQNNLFEELSKLDNRRRIWIEDESLTIGRIFLPEIFWNTMRQQPVVEINVEKEVRIQRLVNEYGKADRGEFLKAMEKIVKRLGGQHFKAAKEKLLADDMHATIDILLTYYDKTYLYGLEKKKQRIIVTVSWNGEKVEDVVSELKSIQSQLSPIRI